MYGPPASDYWKKGRVDQWEKGNSLRWHQAVVPVNLTESLPQFTAACQVALLGFMSDEGVRRNLGRVGAAKGPKALRAALTSLPYPWSAEQLGVWDAGDVCCLGKFLEDAQEDLGEKVELLLDRGVTPLIMGGGHEVAWGHFQGIARHMAKKKDKPSIGIINFDAHFDLRNYLDIGSSGTPFLQIAHDCERRGWAFHYLVIGIHSMGNTRALFERAQALGVRYISLEALYEQPIPGFYTLLDEFVADKDFLYLTCCLDVFSAAFAPGVSAVNGLGLAPWHVLPLLRHLVASGKPFSFDIAELNPKYDIDGRTAKLAAKLLYSVVETKVQE
ncbi:MAG: formimidoylglutamase [Thermonema sp.]|uniref:formimidoylglutamase n=1 Tax=Thermonema sp. TaxID=2231181 RepID=UPI0021DB9E65|nr:formimidoylglutamase [Thermonema sp.]GIV39159.1 MAG: formimidoylglutamase [Thermonema sp.]